MVLDFTKTLSEALGEIGFLDAHHLFAVHPEEKPTTHTTHLIKQYGDAKWAVVDALNKHYGTLLPFQIDLINWLHFNDADEPSYFLNEAGSNSLHYSDFGAPAQFNLWLGRRGFIIAIEQRGRGFNALEIDQLNKKQNEGAAF